MSKTYERRCKNVGGVRAGSSSSGSRRSARIIDGVVIPGFLIVSKTGVVRMNKNYKGEDPFHPEGMD